MQLLTDFHCLICTFRYAMPCKTASRIKHYGFHEENEVRIVVSASTREHVQNMAKNNPGDKFADSKALHFREADNAPYIVLFDESKYKPLFREAIKAVIIGPGSNQGGRLQAVEMMLREFGFNETVAVRSSSIPYSAS